jgi:hypothetical protein
LPGPVDLVQLLELVRALLQNDRRSERRVPGQVAVAIADASARTVALNLSRRGILFTLPWEPPLGQRFMLSLTLPDARTVTVESLVKHVSARDDAHQVGAQFVNVDADTSAALEEAVSVLEIIDRATLR